MIVKQEKDDEQDKANALAQKAHVIVTSRHFISAGLWIDVLARENGGSHSYLQVGQVLIAPTLKVAILLRYKIGCQLGISCLGGGKPVLEAWQA